MENQYKISRRGVTLAEMLIIVGLVMLIVTQLIDIGMSGSRIMDRTSKEIQLQNGIRAVLENLVQDMNAAVAVVSPQDQQVTLARYAGPVDEELFALNLSTVNPAFPYYIDGAPTTIFRKVLFTEYQVSNPDNTNQVSLIRGKEGLISRVAKEGVLEAADADAGVPGFIDTYNVNTAALELVSKKVLARKVTLFQLKYYGYDDQTGQLKSIGELGSEASANALISMLHVHIAAEDPYARETEITPVVEIATKIWSYRHIMENKYPEYFGHTDRDLRF